MNATREFLESGRQRGINMALASFAASTKYGHFFQRHVVLGQMFARSRQGSIVSYLLGLLAMIKCSICSYQCENWYTPMWSTLFHNIFRGGSDALACEPL